MRRMRNAVRGEREVNSPTAHASELWARPEPQEEEGLFCLLLHLRLKLDTTTRASRDDSRCKPFLLATWFAAMTQRRLGESYSFIHAIDTAQDTRYKIHEPQDTHTHLCQAPRNWRHIFMHTDWLRIGCPVRGTRHESYESLSNRIEIHFWSPFIIYTMILLAHSSSYLPFVNANRCRN